jgi:Kef-type K+ transport system membrane component KefB
VVGEILGGVLLGPTLLGRAWPSAHDWLFPATGATPAVLGAVYQLGLLLSMFTAGTQMRSLVSRSAARPVASIGAIGLIFPFLAGLGALAAIDFTRFEGTAQNRTALLLVFAIAIAVTSIPVISRILLDLGLLKTRFAQIVLSVAVIEDVVLYERGCGRPGNDSDGHGEDDGMHRSMASSRSQAPMGEPVTAAN